ncbi:MAG TPA: hypothetical protein VK530_12780, partial [Candidatus Acidoferrum sp.]|nr:hypothetical protein [Candidatus Acidoferrum sp.]
MGGWSDFVANRCAPLLPKLTVLNRDALPLSILNLRASIKTAETLRIENDATSLLIHRLIAQRELFVLERQRMTLLGAEKELKEIQESPFWNGSYLLEGVIEKGGVTRDAISITARLVSPQRSSQTIAAKSDTGDLNQLVEQLTREVLLRLDKTTSAPAWNAAAEAKRYLEEARWATKAAAHQMAQAAIASAWALGERSFDAAQLRVSCYTQGAGNVVHYARFSSQVEVSGPIGAPQPNFLAPLATALENFAELTPLIGTNAKSRAWIDLGLNALDVAGAHLNCFWHHTNESAKAEVELERLRGAARQTERLLSGVETWDAP